MVSGHDKDGGSGAPVLCIRFEDKAIMNIAVLVAGEHRLNFIVVSVKLSDAPQVIFLIAVTVGDGIPGKTPEAGSR
jgi:hypothetical protein